MTMGLFFNLESFNINEVSSHFPFRQTFATGYIIRQKKNCMSITRNSIRLYCNRHRFLNASSNRRENVSSNRREIIDIDRHLKAR